MKATFVILLFLAAAVAGFQINLESLISTENGIFTSTGPLICFGVVLDAGSSSTKLGVYSWPCRNVQSLPQLNPISELQGKISPGLSAFCQNITGIRDYLSPLIVQAKTVIPAEQISSTPIMFGATAGLRLLSQADQDAIVTEVRWLLSSSGFQFEGANWARVITGQQEGVYLWISANYLTNQFTNNTGTQNIPQISSATIDLGGASTQITFQDNNTTQREIDYNYNLTLPENNDFNLYSVSYLGYGNDQARNAVTLLSNTQDPTTIYSGCYNAGYNFTESSTNKTVIGTSNPLQCILQIQRYLNETSCLTNDILECSINGTYQPRVPLAGPIIAVSGVNTAVNSFGVNSTFHPVDLQKASIEFCSLSFSTVFSAEPTNSYIGTKCFLGLYAATLLIDGYHIGDYLISSPDTIEGAEPAWSMGYLFDNISQLSSDDNNSILLHNSPLPHLQKLFQGFQQILNR